MGSGLLSLVGRLSLSQRLDQSHGTFLVIPCTEVVLILEGLLVEVLLYLQYISPSFFPCLPGAVGGGEEVVGIVSLPPLDEILPALAQLTLSSGFPHIL